MFKHLFFDDRYLFNRQNVTRSYGVPKLQTEAIYCDENVSTILTGPWVFKLDNGKYRMLYQGACVNNCWKKGTFSAISDDGIHFSPENIHNGNIPDGFFANNQIMSNNGEVMCIVEDLHNLPSERYKMLFTQVKNLDVIGILYVSDDLINWKLKNEKWSSDGEPIGSAFYNTQKNRFTIISRPAWGVRMCCWNETEDWKTFTPKTHCLQSDSLDEPLAEIYGMYAFEYDGMYVGLPHMYSGFDGEMSAKFNRGTIKAQLAYSHNGNNWFRSLREPFLSGQLPDETAEDICEAPMVWPSSMQIIGNEIVIYACAALFEHGPTAFHTNGLNGRIFAYKLRKDGFIKLENTDGAGVVAVRENIWHGGELHINLKAKRATVAVYRSDRAEDKGMNLLGICELMPAYSHDDCEPFEGDSCDWVPKYKNGNTLDSLKDSTLAFEIKFENGEIYSVSGNMTPTFNLEAERWRKEKRMPSYF